MSFGTKIDNIIVITFVIKVYCVVTLNLRIVIHIFGWLVSKKALFSECFFCFLRLLKSVFHRFKTLFNR